MTMLLELRQVWKIYGSGRARVQAVREVDLAVEGGELAAAVGLTIEARTTRTSCRPSVPRRPPPDCSWRSASSR